MSDEKLKPSAPPPYGTLDEEQDPPPSSGEAGDTTDKGESGDGSSPSSDRCPAVDSRYIRSIEGILRMITILVVITGIIVTSVALYFGPSGWYYFVGIGYVIYVAIVILIETFVPNAHVHRVIDAIVVGIYGVLWGISAIVNTVTSIVFKSALLGVASIFAYVSCGLCIAQVVFAIRTWKKNGNKTGASEPLCGNR